MKMRTPEKCLHPTIAQVLVEPRIRVRIEPYVTTNGGVVILNGPFEIEKAKRVARLCKAAPLLLEALKDLAALYKSSPGHDPHFVEKGMSAIKKAEGQE